MSTQTVALADRSVPRHETPRNPHEIDRHVGRQIAARRVELGWTQGKLADAIGVTYQQVHKYEHGANRVSAGRLFQIAHLLGLPIQYFFPGFAEPRALAPHERGQIELSRAAAGLPVEDISCLADIARRLAAFHEAQAIRTPDASE